MRPNPGTEVGVAVGMPGAENGSLLTQFLQFLSGSAGLQDVAAEDLFCCGHGTTQTATNEADEIGLWENP